MPKETSYLAFFRCELPVEVERDGVVWKFSLIDYGIRASVVAKKAGDQRSYDLAHGPKHYVECCLKEGFDVLPSTVRFDLFLLLAQKGQAEIKVRVRERLDLSKYITAAMKKEGWGQRRHY